MESRVTFHQAATEAGLSDDGLTAVLTPAIDPNLLYLLQAPGRTLSRDVFEDTFDDIMLLKGRPAQPKGRLAMPDAHPNTPIHARIERPEDPRITLKTPTAPGQQQQAKVTIRTSQPTKVLSFATAGGTHMSSSPFRDGKSLPSTEHELDFTFTSGEQGFVKSVEVTLDSGPIVIPVGIGP